MNANELSQKEKLWHDQRFAVDPGEKERYTKVSKFYAASRKAYLFYWNSMCALPVGSALELGCGPHGKAFQLAKAGWNVNAIDISSVAIAQGKERASREGLNIEFKEMDAHVLQYPSESFDLICGSGVLHHLILERALPEALRVLKPGGYAAFHEPLGHNVLINAYRKRTPSLRTEDEHPLLRRDFRKMERLIGPLKMKFFCLASLGASFFVNRPGFSFALRCGEIVDNVILEIPGLKWQAWQIVAIFRKPTLK